MTRDIDQPLGQNGKAPAGRVARWRPPYAAIVAVAAIGALSTIFALNRDPVRTPVVEVKTPDPAPLPAEAPKPAAEAAAPASDPARDPSGPSIIKVDPNAAPSGNSVIVIRDPSALQQNPRTAHLPDRALIEQTEFGPLPKRGADGRRPVDAYAGPWSGARGARIAVVIGGLGLSQTGTQAAIKALPAEITLAFAPSGNSLSRWMQAARQSGHEIVMQLPLEPFDYPRINPGRNTLTVDAGTSENIDHLRWALSRTTNYTGVMNYMGARFTSDATAMAPLMDELGQRGLLYLDDGSSARSQAGTLAPKYRVPFAAADATIDARQDRAEILTKLDELERTARAKGTAIGTGSAFDVTVETVAQWAAEVKKRGIEIVPVSALALDPEK